MRSEVVKRSSVLLVAAVLGLGGIATADDWDAAAESDNTIDTDNTPAHGAEQVHDLGGLPSTASDQDWFQVQTHPLSSYQFVVDGLTGDLDLAASAVQRLGTTGILIEQSTVSDGGGVLSLAWLKAEGATETNFVRVHAASCASACTAADRYRARFYDTTYTVSRFNNSGTQTTVLLVQNVTATNCTVQLAFLDPQGTRIFVLPGTNFSARSLAVFDTSVLAAGQSGSVRVAHTCGYGGLAGKAVSIEPATGFTFDTPFLHRPR
jgi:uncharacterized membrane protein YtjA (UPF0391 family)